MSVTPESAVSPHPISHFCSLPSLLSPYPSVPPFHQYQKGKLTSPVRIQLLHSVYQPHSVNVNTIPLLPLDQQLPHCHIQWDVVQGVIAAVDITDEKV